MKSELIISFACVAVMAATAQDSSPVVVHGEGANRVATVDISGCADGKAMWKLIGEARKAEPGGRIILTGKRPGAISWGIPGTGYPYAETAAECAAAVDFYLGRTEKPGAKAAAKAALASVPEVVYVTHAAFQTWNNRLVPNRKRSSSRLYIVTLLVNLYTEYIMRNAGLDEA